MKELNSTPSKRDKKTFLIHQFLFVILLATSYPTSVFSQTYRKIAGWSDEVNNRIESFLNTTLTMNNRKVAVFDGDGTVIGQVPYYLQMKPCIVMPIKTTRIETIRKQKAKLLY